MRRTKRTDRRLRSDRGKHLPRFNIDTSHLKRSERHAPSVRNEKHRPSSIEADLAREVPRNIDGPLSIPLHASRAS